MSMKNASTVTDEPPNSPDRGRDPRLPAQAAFMSRALGGHAPLTADRTARQHTEGRRSGRRDIAFWILAGLLVMVFVAAAAPSPLYRVYQLQFHSSAATLTAVFAVYVLVLRVTLLFFGSVPEEPAPGLPLDRTHVVGPVRWSRRWVPGVVVAVVLADGTGEKMGLRGTLCKPSR